MVNFSIWVESCNANPRLCNSKHFVRDKLEKEGGVGSIDSERNNEPIKNGVFTSQRYLDEILQATVFPYTAALVEQ